MSNRVNNKQTLNGQELFDELFEEALERVYSNLWFRGATIAEMQERLDVFFTPIPNPGQRMRRLDTFEKEVKTQIMKRWENYLGSLIAPTVEELRG